MNKELLEHLKTYLQLHHDQNDGGVHINLIARIDDELAKTEPDPFYCDYTWDDEGLICLGEDRKLDLADRNHTIKTPLYTSPPTHQKPLSDDEIDDILNECVELEEYYDNSRGDSKRWVLKDETKFARAIERRVRGDL